MATIRNNLFTFEASGVQLSDFKLLGHVVSQGQPFGQVSAQGSAFGLVLNIEAGRHKTAAVAQYFNKMGTEINQVSSPQSGSRNLPHELNFAIEASMKVDGKEFTFNLGQGSTGGRNDWHLISQEIRSNSKSFGSLLLQGTIYTLDFDEINKVRLSPST